VGNEDMHLKNFSLITRDEKVTLTPAYDLLNSSIVQSNTREELALSLHGKQSNLTRNDFVNYFAKEHLRLNVVVIDDVLVQFKKAIPQWQKLLLIRFSHLKRKKYLSLLAARCTRLGL
jgi:serine/threonine-protein kinase HipA